MSEQLFPACPAIQALTWHKERRSSLPSTSSLKTNTNTSKPATFQCFCHHHHYHYPCVVQNKTTWRLRSRADDTPPHPHPYWSRPSPQRGQSFPKGHRMLIKTCIHKDSPVRIVKSTCLQRDRQHRCQQVATNCHADKIKSQNQEKKIWCEHKRRFCTALHVNKAVDAHRQINDYGKRLHDVHNKADWMKPHIRQRMF